MLSISTTLLQFIRNKDRSWLLALQERCLAKLFARAFPVDPSTRSNTFTDRLWAGLAILADCLFGLLRDIYRAVLEPLPLFFRDLAIALDEHSRENSAQAAGTLATAILVLLLSIPARLFDMFLRCARCLTDVADVLISQARMRLLRDEERDMLERIFGNALVYSLIRVKLGCFSHRFLTAHAAGNVIYIPVYSRYFDLDNRPAEVEQDIDPIGVALSETGESLLVHEATHVWQHQNGGSSYMHRALFVQCCAWLVGGKRSGAYDWRSELARGRAFCLMNPEQQAQLVQDNAAAMTYSELDKQPGTAIGVSEAQRCLLDGRCY